MFSFIQVIAKIQEKNNKKPKINTIRKKRFKTFFHNNSDLYGFSKIFISKIIKLPNMSSHGMAFMMRNLSPGNLDCSRASRVFHFL